MYCFVSLIQEQVVKFKNLRIVQLENNRLHSIDTLYFSSNYLTLLSLPRNQLRVFNRLVFENDDSNANKNLVINLSFNYLSRIPRFYGNVSEVKQIWMAMQKNNSLAVLGDNFFDNSMPFLTDLKVLTDSKLKILR